MTIKITPNDHDVTASSLALRKDNRELRMERVILKKATAFFAKNQA